MPAIRIATDLEVKAAAGEVTFEDRNYRDWAGWKEIVITPGKGGALLAASHGGAERSEGLTKYPANALSAAPGDLRARLEWAPAGSIPAREPVITPIAQPGSPEPPRTEIARSELGPDSRQGDYWNDRARAGG